MNSQTKNDISHPVAHSYQVLDFTSDKAGAASRVKGGTSWMNAGVAMN